MYEVEKTISFNDEFLQKLAGLGKLQSEKIFTDSYWDTRDYQLIKKSFWLRERDGKWELKIYASDGNGMGMSEEITDSLRITELLDLPAGDVRSGLEKGGYRPFCELSSTRKRYSVNGMSVDLDSVKGESFDYQIGEVEMEVARQDEMPQAAAKIAQFVWQNGLSEVKTRGKVLEYLWQVKPEVYRMLVEKGVIEDG